MSCIWQQVLIFLLLTVQVLGKWIGLKNCKDEKENSVNDSLLKNVYAQIKKVYAQINVHAF